MLVGQVFVHRDELRAAYYERRHGGPLRLVVESVERGDEWHGVVTLRAFTGPVRRTNRVSMGAYRLLDEYRLEAGEVAA